MPEALPLPPDLIQLQRVTVATGAALGEYVTTVETRRRSQYPSPEQIVERRTWSEDETAELKDLAAARDAAVRAVRQHPTLVQALEDRCWRQTWEALQDAARAAA